MESWKENDSMGTLRHSPSKRNISKEDVCLPAVFKRRLLAFSLSNSNLLHGRLTSSLTQVNVPPLGDNLMSVDGAKPKVFEDLINRLLSRAEH